MPFALTGILIRGADREGSEVRRLGYTSEGRENESIKLRMLFRVWGQEPLASHDGTSWRNCMEAPSLPQITPSGEWFQQLPAIPAEAAGRECSCVRGRSPQPAVGM